MEFTELFRSTFAKPHIRELFAEYGYAVSGKVILSPNRKKATPYESVSEKDRLIAELRPKNAELERECELLRGRLF